MQPGWVLFDWGDTLMVDFTGCAGPMATWDRVEATAHAHEAVKSLSRLGWHLALATNASASSVEDIRTALARVGLSDAIERIYCSGNTGYWKPSSDFFSFIQQDLGVSASELVMVGDSYEVDCAGANHCGIRAVWLCSAAESAADDHLCRVIRNLGELPTLLESWE